MNHQANQRSIVSCVLFLLLMAGSLSAQSVTINVATKKQLIRGFGGINHPIWTGYDLSEAERSTAFGNGSGELGMSVLRIWVSDKTSDWNRELATAQRAIALGAIVFATPWNPPSTMTEVVSRNNRQEKRLKYDQYAAYAKHLNDFVTFMKNNGVDLYAISVQNEPDYAAEWTWWSPEEILRFMKENAASIQCRIIAPESFQYRKQMSDPILNDATALANMDILGSHLYGTQLSQFPYPLYQQKKAGKELWMTEVYTESNNDADLWPLALDVAYNIHNSMVEAEFNAYVWWYIKRKYSMIRQDNSNVTKRGWCMAHYSKYVRPGYYRVDATKNPTADVYVSAFTGVDSLVVVVVNRATSSKTVSFKLDGYVASSGVKFSTSGSKSLENQGSITLSNGAVSTSFDAQSVTTLLFKSGGQINLSSTSKPSSTNTSSSISTSSGASSSVSNPVSLNMMFNHMDPYKVVQVFGLTGNLIGSLKMKPDADISGQIRLVVHNPGLYLLKEISGSVRTVIVD